jgi:hypothetical protein
VDSGGLGQAKKTCCEHAQIGLMADEENFFKLVVGLEFLQGLVGGHTGASPSAGDTLNTEEFGNGLGRFCGAPCRAGQNNFGSRRMLV